MASIPNLQAALETLGRAITEVETVLREMQSEHDALAAHIFVSRRHYRNIEDTKSGRRREMHAQLSWETPRELGFHGRLEEWARLLGAAPKR